jgi:TP901 family phage tail tape measure protein
VPTVSELEVVVGADVSQAESKLSSFSSGMGGMLAGGVVAAGAAIAAGVAVGVKAAGDLEQAVANISTIKPEIDTGAVFSALNDMSTRIPQSASELGASLYNVFSSMDVGEEAALRLTETFGKGATAAQTDAETFGTSIMGVLNAYKLSADDATHVSDVFFNTVKLGVVTGQELASSLGPVTQSAKSAGVGIDELGAMIAAVTREGGPAAQNINNLNNFLQKVTTKDAQKELKGLGIATTDATGAFRPTTDVLTDLKAKLGGMTESARANAMQAIFPDAQARIGAEVLLSQLDMVKSATEENRTASGVAEAAYKTMSETFNSQSKLLMQGLMAVLTTVGAAILPVITPLITAFAQSLPGAFAAAQAALAPFVPIITGLFSSLMASLPTVVSLMQGLFAVFSGSASIAEMMNVAQILTSIFGPEATQLILTFTQVAGDAFRAVAAVSVEQFGMIVSWVQENWPLIQETVRVVLEQIAIFWDNHGAAIIAVVQSAWTIISTTITGALDIVLSVIKAAMQLITGDWEGAWTTLSDVADRTLDRLGTIVGAALDAVVAVIEDQTDFALTKTKAWLTDTTASIQRGWELALNAVENAWQSIKSSVQGAVDGVSRALEDAWTSINDAISSAWDGFKSTISDALQGIQDAVQATWEAIPEDIRRDMELIAKTLLTRGKEWIENVTKVGSEMLEAIGDKLSAIVDAVSTWAESTVLAPIRGLISTATSAALEVGSGIWKSITTKLTEVATAVSTWATSTFLAPIQTLVGTATTEASNVGSGILTSITGKLGDVITALGTWVGSFLAPLRGLIDTARGIASSIGQAIIDGVTGAVNSGASAISGAIGSAVRGGLAAAKQTLGIESPSKVFFEQIGVPIVEGMALGILSGSTIVSQAARTVVAQAVSQADAALQMAQRQFSQAFQAMEWASMEAESARRRGSLPDIQSLLGGLGASMGAGQSLIRQFSQLASGSIGPNQSAEWLAQHGFIPSGPGTIKGFAEGGIVTGPTLGLIGEGRNDEAILPLPADWRNGGGATGPMVTHHFVIQDPRGKTLADWYVQGQEQAFKLGMLHSSGYTFANMGLGGSTSRRRG